MADSLLHLSLRPVPSRLPLLRAFPSSATPGSGELPPSRPHRNAPLREVIDRSCGYRMPPRLGGFKAQATPAGKDGPKWWEKTAGENMIDVHSTEEFLNVLSQAGEKLVIVEFYGTWCASCRALFPKLCRTAKDNPDIIFVKVNFDENKPMCRRLSVKVLPYFHFYRGADGLLESFSCSLPKFQKLKDAIAVHNTARCSIGPPTGVGNLDLVGDADPISPKEQSTEAGKR